MGRRFCSIWYRNHVLLNLLLLLLLHSAKITKGDVCNKIDSCSCELSDGTFIDLSPLNQNSVTPRFVNITGTQTSNLFSWNPCSSFTQQECVDVAVCETVKLLPYHYISLGTQDSAKFLHDGNGSLMISYTAKSDGINPERHTYITLMCDPTQADNLTVYGATALGSGNYTMTLVSKHACPLDHNDEKPKGLSAGWIVFIVMLVLLVSYFLIGSVYNKFVKKASGKEILPHYQLFADGCGQAAACCWTKKERNTYSSV